MTKTFMPMRTFREHYFPGMSDEEYKKIEGKNYSIIRRNKYVR